MFDHHQPDRPSDASERARAAEPARPKQPASAEEVLVLRTLELRRATKLHRYDAKLGRWHSSAYDAGMFFEYERRRVTAANSEH